MLRGKDPATLRLAYYELTNESSLGRFLVGEAQEGLAGRLRWNMAICAQLETSVVCILAWMCGLVQGVSSGIIKCNSTVITVTIFFTPIGKSEIIAVIVLLLCYWYSCYSLGQILYLITYF